MIKHKTQGIFQMSTVSLVLASIAVGFAPPQTEEDDRLHSRVQSLIKAKKFDDAEKTIDLLESRAKNLIADRMRAEIALHRGEYEDARTKFHKHYFPKDQPPRSSGDAEEHAWFYFLSIQAGRQKEADLMFGLLLSEPPLDPMGGDEINIKASSPHRLAVVYVYLAARMNSRRNFYRMKFYLDRAKEVDSRLKLHKNFAVAIERFGFSEKLNLDYELKYGSGYPLVDHRAFERATKSKAKVN